MAKIRVLSDHLASQIAAGEVVERAASVVKEMLENSLDAGAQRITIEVEGGGRRLLRIADDGEGMARDDAVLAFERHATSKLKTAEDLSRITTLGFRGEALASIAAVSKVELVTKTADAHAATKVVIEGGRVRDVRDAARPTGTTFTVRDLFFNVPARRKFLRSEATETYHLSNLVTHYALAHPEIAFTLTSNGRETLRATPARDLKERAYQLFGAAFTESLLPVKSSAAQMAQINGYVSVPTERRTSREAQYFFVNGRYVRDKLLLKALSEGYRAVLPPGTYPAALLFVAVPHEEIDVNVHPAKTEVRFRRAAALAEAVRDAVREALTRGGYVRQQPSVVSGQPSVVGEAGIGQSSVAGGPQAGSRQLAAGSSESVVSGQPSVAGEGEADGEASMVNGQWSMVNEVVSGPQVSTQSGSDGAQVQSSSDGPQVSTQSGSDGPQLPAFASVLPPQNVLPLTAPTVPEPSAEPTEVPIAATDRTEPAGREGSGTITVTEPSTVKSDSKNQPAPPSQDIEPHAAPEGTLAALSSFVSGAHLLREVPTAVLSDYINPLGQLAETFIIAADDEGLLLIDQHIAHERILFERYRQRETARPLEAQRLLLPEIFDLTPAQAAVFSHVEPDLAACGFDLMRLSGRTVAIKAAPADLPHAETRALLTEILDAIETERRGSARADWRDQIAGKLACRAAVKARTKLAPEKMRWLIKHLLTTDATLASPHGHSGVLRLTLKDIEKGLQRS